MVSLFCFFILFCFFLIKFCENGEIVRIPQITPIIIQIRCYRLAMAETQRKRDLMLILTDLYSYIFKINFEAEGFPIAKELKF